MNILDTIVAYTKTRIAEQKLNKSLEQVKEEAELLAEQGCMRQTFKEAIGQPGLSFICECKKASPSKGILAADFRYLQLAQQYETAGAAAISVLTEPHWFLGRDEYLQKVAATVSIPCLRKDFVVDSYMLYEAKILGAQAVLLIASILTDAELKEYLTIVKALAMDALVEVHDEAELKRALAQGAEIIGANNRNLHDFSVDIGISAKIKALLPPEVLFVAESGMLTRNDIETVERMGADAVLAGEAFVKSTDVAAKLKELQGKPKMYRSEGKQHDEN